MNTKGIKKKVTQWYEKNKLAIGVGLGAAVIGSVVLLKKTFKGQDMGSYARKNENGDVGLYLVRKNFLGQYDYREIIWDPETARKAGNTLIEAADHTFEELKEVPGWSVVDN